MNEIPSDQSRALREQPFPRNWCRLVGSGSFRIGSWGRLVWL